MSPSCRGGRAAYQVILRFGSDEMPEMAGDLTLETIRRIQADGTCFMGGARWRDRWVMRVSVISATTTDADAERTIEAVLRAWRSVRDQKRVTA
jgi:hypothetical protein